MYTIDFFEKLGRLNHALTNALLANKVEPVLLGNLFYDHLELNFFEHKPNPLLETKRQRLYDLAKKCTTAFEVGVNGGHSAFLMLHSNPALKYIGNDIAAYYPPEPRCHPEIYVPAAFNALAEIFPERVFPIIGNCLLELPKYAQQYPLPHIDLLHLDGNKETYAKDFFTLLPLMKKDGYVVIDDTQQPNVQALADYLVEKKILKRTEYPKMSPLETYTHEILTVI